MDYVLKHSLTSNDIDFLNETTLDFAIITNNHQVESDSGWRDAATGARIINANDRAVFKNVAPADVTLLTLKYGDRVSILHNGLARIYKYNTHIE